MATVKHEVMMVIMVLVLEVLMNHIGIDDEDTLGYSVGSVDGMTYEKKSVGSFPENILKRRADSEMVGSGYGP